MKKAPKDTVVPAPTGGKKSSGPTSAQMKAVGRNMARVNNQKGK